MDEPKFCVLCGVRPVGDGRVKTCSPECWEVFHGLAHMEWPIALGHAIARFCRRAEVAALVATLTERIEHGGLCRMAGRCVCGAAEAVDDLDRLARLAGGGA